MSKLSQVLTSNYPITLLRIYCILEPQLNILGRCITSIKRQRKAETKLDVKNKNNIILYITICNLYITIIGNKMSFGKGRGR